MSKTSSLTPRLLLLKSNLSRLNGSGLNEKADAAVGLMLLEEGKDLETLLIQRSERHDDPWSGQIGLPGGRVKDTDPSIRSTLRREVIEEVGIDLAKTGEELGALSIGQPMRRLDMKVQPCVYALLQRPEVEIGPEVSSAFWVSLPGLPSKRATSEVLIRDEPTTVDCFQVDGKVVWGYTYRVLTELMQLPGILTS